MGIYIYKQEDACLEIRIKTKLKNMKTYVKGFSDYYIPEGSLLCSVVMSVLLCDRHKKEICYLGLKKKSMQVPSLVDKVVNKLSCHR